MRASIPGNGLLWGFIDRSLGGKEASSPRGKMESGEKGWRRTDATRATTFGEPGFLRRIQEGQRISKVPDSSTDLSASAGDHNPWPRLASSRMDAELRIDGVLAECHPETGNGCVVRPAQAAQRCPSHCTPNRFATPGVHRRRGSVLECGGCDAAFVSAIQPRRPIGAPGIIVLALRPRAPRCCGLGGSRSGFGRQGSPVGASARAAH